MNTPGSTPKTVTDELLPGEVVLWFGQPLRRVVFHPSDRTVIPFSLAWAGFTVFWEDKAVRGPGNLLPALAHLDFFALWGLGFLLVGQYLVWGRFVYAGWRKARTFYALTTQRVLVITTARERRVFERALPALETLVLTTREDGVGSVEFDEGETMAAFPARRGGSSRPRDTDLDRLAFLDIAEAREVRERIRRAQAGAQPRPSSP